MTEIDFSTILHIILVLQTLLFSLILFSFRNLRGQSNKVLSVFMLITFAQFLLNAFEIFKFYEGAIIGYYLIIPLMLCNAPILYLYVRILTIPDYKPRWLFLVHFAPAAIILIINIFSYGNISHDVKIDIIMQKHFSLNPSDSFFLNFFTKAYFLTSQFFYNGQVLLYSILMILRLRKHRKNIYTYFSYTENISLNWLGIFIIAFVLISLYEILFYDYSVSLYLVIINIYFLFLGFFGVKQTDIYIGRLKDLKELNNSNLSFGQIVEQLTKDPNKEIIETATIINSNEIDNPTFENKIKVPKEIMNSYILKLKTIMETDKPYLDSTLSLPDLADRLKINRNILSQVINETYNKNFFNFINEYRIKEAQLRLLDPNYDNLSIEGLAKEVGFNSKSVFNPAFKKLTGKTPAEFKKAHR